MAGECLSVCLRGSLSQSSYSDRTIVSIPSRLHTSMLGLSCSASAGYSARHQSNDLPSRCAHRPTSAFRQTKTIAAQIGKHLLRGAKDDNDDLKTSVDRRAGQVQCSGARRAPSSTHPPVCTQAAELSVSLQLKRTAVIDHANTTKINKHNNVRRHNSSVHMNH